MEQGFTATVVRIEQQTEEIFLIEFESAALKDESHGAGTKFGCCVKSMARWIQLASEWLKPIYRQIKEQMMSGPYIQVDETPIKYLNPGNGKAGLGYLGVAHRSGGRGF